MADSLSIDGSETFETFFATVDQFKLGGLVTESPNPITTGLAEQCQSNLPNALQLLQLADVTALQRLATNKAVMPKIAQLASDIHDTLEAGSCVFFVGCGATGRLSLTIEVLVREGLIADKYRDQVKGFMAGGDAALIRSIEQFEDRRDHGTRQLIDMGYVEGDLCVAITEGGETTFVIAAVEAAVDLGPARKHWFLYCNPDEVLCPAAERSKKVIENDKIIKMNLTCGPMAITGSTRMQATTVQLLVAGLCVQYHDKPAQVEKVLGDFASFQATLDYADFAPATHAEAMLYKNNIPFCYRTEYFTCTVLTDSTERAPTFSLPAFESFAAEPTQPATPCYLHLPGTRSAHDAWQRLLRREPRGIAWDDLYKRTGNRALMGYDFSDNVVAKRRPLISDSLAARTNSGADLAVEFALSKGKRKSVDENGGEEETCFLWWRVPLVASFLNDGASSSKVVQYVVAGVHVPIQWIGASKVTPASRFQPPETNFTEPLLLNIVAKMILNAHSTAVMGVIGRIRSNLMTFVRPSNKKLIDRAARYVLLLLDELLANKKAEERKKISYEDVVREIFVQRDTLGAAEPIVVKVYDVIVKREGL